MDVNETLSSPQMNGGVATYGLGAEIYRGLAAVVAGGMVIGTGFTWFLMPALLRLGEATAARRAVVMPAMAK